MVLGEISTAIAATNGLRTLLSSFRNAGSDSEKLQRETEFFEQVRILEDALIKSRGEIIRLQDDNRTLNDTVRELKEKLSLQGMVSWDDPFIWKQEGDKKDGPYCQKCWDDESKLMHLIDRDKQDLWHCNKCNKYYHGPNYGGSDTDVCVVSREF